MCPLSFSRRGQGLGLFASFFARCSSPAALVDLGLARRELQKLTFKQGASIDTYYGLSLLDCADGRYTDESLDPLGWARGLAQMSGFGIAPRRAGKDGTNLGTTSQSL